jgi:signal transduction histidine kinase
MKASQGMRWCLFCIYCLILCSSTQASPLQLKHAQVSVNIDGQTTSAVQVDLPYAWDRRQPGKAGEATFDLVFHLGLPPTEPYSLYLPRLGNAYEIWLNGELLERRGDFASFNGTDFGKSPVHVRVMPELLKADNWLRIRIRADAGRRAGLSAVMLGPEQLIYPDYQHHFRWRMTGALVVVIVSVLVGVMALTLWATQPVKLASGDVLRDRLYLLSGVAELSWAFSLSDRLLEDPPLAWPWWGFAIFIAAVVWFSSMLMFCAELAGWRGNKAAVWLSRWLAVIFAASLVAVTLALLFGQTIALTVIYAVSSATTLVFMLFFAWKGLKQRSIQHSVLLVAIVFNGLVGARDVYVLRLALSFGETLYLPYSSLLFGLTLGYIVLDRFRAASQQVVELNANLARQVAQKETELATSYQRLAQGVQEQARSGERSRILRDMHDGVGSHISTAIRQLQSGRASGDEVLQTLRDSLDQLKLSIDAIHLPPGDVTALLANLRYRLEPRLKACGIELDWAVEALAPVAALDAGAMRQLQFMLFEAISNVMQHARASQLRIEARQLGPGVQVRVVDNGCGFDTSQVPRRGLRLMQERAQTIGARLTVGSQPGLTSLAITLPAGPANGRLL